MQVCSKLAVFQLNSHLSLMYLTVWQEAFENGQGLLSKKAIVHVWKNENWQNVTLQVRKKKLRWRFKKIGGGGR